ncbi:MAG: LicD family protein [Clostridia bacterium]|nr:LicD family protein [Clostridia bacterium]
MAGQYDPEILRKLQLCELEILNDFIKVCEENNLTYFGFGGTGIGALRHGGFIPWDDDIDLCIPRADYVKAMEIFERDFADKYTVVSAEKFNDFPVMNTHIIINDSKFITAEDKRGNYPKGIFLDIFPVDNAPADETLRKKYMRKAWFLSKLLILKHLPFPNLPLTGIKAKIAHCVTATAWLFLNVFFISHKFLYNLCLKECTKYNHQETGVWAYSCDTVADASVFVKSKSLPLRKEKFENIEICFPNNLEENLTALYGDYMQIPPPEKRHNHRPDVLEFPTEKPQKNINN